MLCISLIIPQVSICATEVGGTPGIEEPKEGEAPEEDKDTEKGEEPEEGKEQEEEKGTEKGENPEKGDNPEEGKDAEKGEKPEEGKDAEKGEEPKEGEELEKGEDPEEEKDIEKGEKPEEGGKPKENEDPEEENGAKKGEEPEEGKKKEEGDGSEENDGLEGEEAIWQSVALLSSGIDDYLGEPASGAHGSGSYQLNEVPDDYRFYTEYYVGAASGKKDTTAGIKRRTTIQVYAKEGEVILFGSSVANSEIDENNSYIKKVTGKDIVITTPTGTKVSKDVLAPSTSNPNGVGYIANPTQEKNGPMVNHTDQGNSNYYTPLRYDVTKSGVYTFEFHSQRGYNDGSLPSPKKADDPNWQQGTTTVAAWDVTVVGKDSSNNWEVKEGRAWADYLALTTGSADNVKSDLAVHVLTHDGYDYKVSFNEAVPFGFIFFANNTGFMTPVKNDKGEFESYRPIYHSFYDSTNDLDNMEGRENICLHKPNEADTKTEETYKIFFNAPSSDLNGIKDIKDVEIKTSPDEKVSLNDLEFHGISKNVALAGHGGHFTFTSSGEAMVTIILDLRKAILDSGSTMESYKGSGIVEITGPAVPGDNSFYWDGKDTEGVMLPAGIYGNNNVVLATEIKRGELHFPVIDMEGLYDGLTVERINGTGSDDSRFNLYYNNNPLVYGNIEGKDYKRVTTSGYDILSDGTKSYKIETTKYFNTNQQDTITTLVKDDEEYLAEKFFDTSYGALDADKKAIIDAEFGKEQDTFHFNAVDSRTTSMKFTNGGKNGNEGGGNQAGIDAWTYYTQSVSSNMISFALMYNDNKGLIRGQVFYDENKDSKFDTTDKDYPLSHMKVRLIGNDGKPLVHEESLPCFDETGHFIYDGDGNVKHELKQVEYEAMTDSSGYYRFTGVPYVADENNKIYVQVLLTDIQSEVLRYACTTSEVVKDKFVTSDNKHFLEGTISDNCGPDGNKIVSTNDIHKIYGHKYDRISINSSTNETVFVSENAQYVTFSADTVSVNGIFVQEFKKIGYCSTVPKDNLKDYTVTKTWGTNSQGIETHKISDGLIVELWVWNDSDVKEENPLKLSRRTGALVDTQVLNEDNHWTYTWRELDDRLQYYVLEYYTKKKPNGEIIYNDKNEPRKVLIGGTMPIFSTVPSSHSNGKYGFQTKLGDYPETLKDESGNTYIPIQKFSISGDELTHNPNNEHANSITDVEKLESVDNNARQYNVTYKLSVSGNTNVINLINSQAYDDRTYYVWLDHETVLPDMVAQTYVSDNGLRNDHAVDLYKDKEIVDGEWTIKGLSVSSVDAAESDNVEGNATKAFRIRDNGKSALFTATNHGNYKTGTGTRTYRVKYVVDGTTKKAVSVKPNDNHELVLADNENVKVESNESYIVYSWYMTIHVYDVEPDGVFEYDPKGGAINLQEALSTNKELKWKLIHYDEKTVSYNSDDERTSGILHNDIYRVPLYKAAENPDMGSCADLVGIAYAGSTSVNDVSNLKFADTYESCYGTIHEDVDGIATSQGNGGYVTVALNTLRTTRINRVQDHANYAEVTFTPGIKDTPSPVSSLDATGSSGTLDSGDDVFYYKVAVFSEDSTYLYSDYDDIDASEGVVMYTYFTMRPKTVDPGDPGNPSDPTDPSDPEDPEDPEDPGDPGENPGKGPGKKPPKGPIFNPVVNPITNPEFNNSLIFPEGELDANPVTNLEKEIIIVPMEDSAQSPIFVIRSAELNNLGAKTKVNGPKTGDDSNISVWILIECFGISLIVSGIYINKRRYVRR